MIENQAILDEYLRLLSTNKQADIKAFVGTLSEEQQLTLFADCMEHRSNEGHEWLLI